MLEYITKFTVDYTAGSTLLRKLLHKDKLMPKHERVFSELRDYRSISTNVATLCSTEKGQSESYSKILWGRVIRCYARHTGKHSLHALSAVPMKQACANFKKVECLKLCIT